MFWMKHVLLAIVILVIYGLRFIGRLLAPWLARKTQSKMKDILEKKMKERGFTNSHQDQKPEGTVSVEKVRKSAKSKPTSSDDEYVDFEEIKD